MGKGSVQSRADVHHASPFVSVVYTVYTISEQLSRAFENLALRELKRASCTVGNNSFTDVSIILRSYYASINVSPHPTPPETGWGIFLVWNGRLTPGVGILNR